MDFVYTCRDGDNEELRYSIRSVINSFPDANIWVVGGKPEWYAGNYIKVSQSKNSHTNQLNNFLAACNSDNISDSFILMNDDFFIIKTISDIKYFYSGLLSDKVDLYYNLVSDNSYVRSLMQTLSRLKKYKIQEPLDYELHVPFPVEKNKFKQILEKDSRFEWRSMYGNKFAVGGMQMQDVKIYHSGNLKAKSFDYKNNNSSFLSTLDESFLEIQPMLERLFPNKTNFEK